MATHVALGKLGRLQAAQRLLTSISHQMGSTSPEEVLKAFIKILKSASPRLKLTIALFTPWALLGSAILKYVWANPCFQKLKQLISDGFYASVSIPSVHPVHKQVLTYMVEQGLGKHAKTLAVAAPSQGIGSSPWRELDKAVQMAYVAYGNRANKFNNLKQQEDSLEKQALDFVPEIGQYAFWYNFYRMTFERKGDVQETPFSGARPIQDFLQHVQAAPPKDRSTTIYHPDVANKMWDQGITRPSRNLNAVTLDSKVKNDLVMDIEIYLSPATRRYYVDRGIPYRRGLLFYGNPRCGKTSFANALAGYFGLNIYMFSLSTTTITDTLLEALFERLPSRCIVLLEDIDSAGLTRESMRTKRKKVNSAKRQKLYDVNGNQVFGDEDVTRESVTLSGLLNVLDGIHSKEGILTIMTSNSPDTLDPALVRPGRIDRKILFGYCSREVLTKLFRHIFEKSPEELVEGENVSVNSRDIEALSEAFADQIPANKLTPAEVQGYLLLHRENPSTAVEEVAAWAKQTIERKAAGANVDNFASEIQPDAGNTDASRRATSRHRDSAIELTRYIGPPPDSPVFSSEIETDRAAARGRGDEHVDIEQSLVDIGLVSCIPVKMPQPSGSHAPVIDARRPSTTTQTNTT